MDMEHPATQVDLAAFLPVQIPWCKAKSFSYCTAYAVDYSPIYKEILSNIWDI
jgi:hypothetical protein